MTEQERAKFYEARRDYFYQSEAFKKRLWQYLEHYQPKHKTETT